MSKQLLFIYRIILLFYILFICTINTNGQSNPDSQIDSLLENPTSKPFNGVIIISQKGKILYSKNKGFADIEKKIPVQLNDQFYIGSISKQITAVLVLREVEKGHLKLNDPIRKYLPQLTEKWADTVSIHHLLTHIHGIVTVDKPLAFTPGTHFFYSQIGYQLLADIIEKTSLKSFENLSTELFKRCKMQNTFYPHVNKPEHLVNGYTEQPDGSLQLIPEPLKDISVAAGGFISTAKDLAQWNEYLHNGKLLADTTYKMMITKQKNATRQHPISGPTEYGYGITVNDSDNILQLGQTGYVPGFPTMNFYYPASKKSIIILSNISWDLNDFKKTFYYLIETLKIIKRNKN